jgi:hypothetical protein
MQLQVRIVFWRVNTYRWVAIDLFCHEGSAKGRVTRAFGEHWADTAEKESK